MTVVMVPGNASRCPECGSVEQHARWHAKENGR